MKGIIIGRDYVRDLVYVKTGENRVEEISREALYFMQEEAAKERNREYWNSVSWWKKPFIRKPFSL